MNSRASAARTLVKVIKQSSSLDLALGETFNSVDEQQERSFIQAICFGVMRWYPRLKFIVNSLLEKPLKQKDTDIEVLIMVGVYQLDKMRTPEHAAVSETVDACNTLKKSWAKNLVNAVLRRYLREKSQLEILLENEDSAVYAHPDWLIEEFKLNWPAQWSSLLEKNNESPPMHLRVNLTQISRDDYIGKLKLKKLESTESPVVESGITLEIPVPVEQLPDFSSGKVSVQDFGAQLAAPLLNLMAGIDVLDACAAPGGKTSHIYEIEPKLGKLIAIDRGEKRTSLLRNTQQRLGTKMQVIDADAADVECWWDGEFFDRILLDAPCSASGVIQRHPDIKMLRRPEQLDKLIKTQARLLDQLWPLLKQGGRMVYSTCSMFKQENDAQIEKLIDKHDDVDLVKINAKWGVATEFGRQTLPTQDGTDGFYYVVLEKRPV